MSKKGKKAKPSQAMMDKVAEQMRRLEAAGWLTFHGFRGVDGHVAVEPSDNLLRMIALSGMPAEMLVARLLHSMDELDEVAERFKTRHRDGPHYV